VEQEDVWALFGLQCATVYRIGEGTANEKKLKLNGTVGSLFCANVDNLLGENKHTLFEENERFALWVASN
jgi:hypothetical protein